MARREHSREDLLRDARALVPRVRFERIGDGPAPVVVCGFRGDAMSVYFDEDPVYHFNGAGELRRSFCDGKLLKADAGKLVAMTRERTDATSALASRNLTSQENAESLARAECELGQLAKDLAGGAYRVAGEEPPVSDAQTRVVKTLALALPVHVARTPRVGD